MIKKMIAALLVAGSIGNAYAVCPRNLNGAWSGSVVKTVNAAFGNADGGIDQMPPKTTNGTFTATVFGGSFTTTWYGESESGGWGGFQETETPTTYPLTYNKATCRGTIDTGERKIYFTVSNSGKMLKGISNKKEEGSFGDLKISSGETAMWSLERQ